MATQHQLVDAGLATREDLPPRPWLRINASGDATTMWYAVLRKQERGVFIGTLVFRHSPHHSSLLEQGWEEVPVPDIRPDGPQAADRRAQAM